jgi:hypothetical protein
MSFRFQYSICEASLEHHNLAPRTRLGAVAAEKGGGHGLPGELRRALIFHEVGRKIFFHGVSSSRLSKADRS